MNKVRFKNFIIKHAKTFRACTYDGTTNDFKNFTNYSDAMAWLSSRPEPIKRLEVSSEKGVFYSDCFIDIEEILRDASESGYIKAFKTWRRLSNQWNY